MKGESEKSLGQSPTRKYRGSRKEAGQDGRETLKPVNTVVTGSAEQRVVCRATDAASREDGNQRELMQKLPVGRWEALLRGTWCVGARPAGVMGVRGVDGGNRQL